tara:strand:- start:233 stop:547 length:315 start_codon:yes stop_codon:yes gene_type:complete
VWGISALLPEIIIKMKKNKKGQGQWMWLVGAAIAIGIFVITWIIAGGSLGVSKKNLAAFQSCEGQNGQCRSTACNPGESQHYKQLGCGSGDFEGQDYCCLPENT